MQDVNNGKLGWRRRDRVYVNPLTFCTIFSVNLKMLYKIKSINLKEKKSKLASYFEKAIL